MLRAMRADFKKYSWTLWLVIIAFVGGFIVTDAFRGESRAEMGLIYIDDQPVIRAEEFQQQLMRRLQTYKEQFKDNFNKSMISQWRIPEQTLQEMTRTTIILMEAEKLNIEVSDKELRDQIIKLPVLQRDGKFVGQTAYLRWLNAMRMDATEFENQFKKQVIGEKLQELVSGPLVIDDDTLLDKYKREKDQADLDYITFLISRVKEDINPTDNELTTYYEKNKEVFKSLEKRAAYVIAFKFDDYKKEVNITPQEIYESFKIKRAEFRLPGKTKVSRIFLKYGENDREEILKKAQELQKELTKENFADQAKLLSQDDKAKEGGDYGYAGWQNFTKQEKTMIEALEQGEISSPIDTQKGGFSIVYVSEKVAERQQNFNDVKDRIKDTIEQERVKKLVMEKLQKIYNKLGKAENIKAKASEMGIKAIETELLSSGRPIKDIDQMGYISRKIFELEEKEIAFPVQFVKGIAIVQLEKIEKPTVESFEKVKIRVKGKVMLAKKVERLMEEAAVFSAKLNLMTDEKKIEEFLEKEDLSPTAYTYKRGNRLSGYPVTKGLDEKVFSMEENRYSTPMEFNNQVVIFKVKSKTIVNTADFEKDKTEFYKQQVTQSRNRFFSSYIANKMSNYKVAQNQELFDQIKDYVITRFN
jgi:parvulin-like peptidyl-prolyl isomerase